MNNESIAEQLKYQVSGKLNELIGNLTKEAEENPKHWQTALAQRQLKQFVNSLLEQNVESQSQLHQLQSRVKEVTERSAKMERTNQTLVTALDALNATATIPPPSLPVKATSNNKPFHELLRKYLTAKEAEVKPRTFIQLKSNLTRFVEVIGYETESESLCSDDIEEYCYVICNIAPNFKFSNFIATEVPTNSQELSDLWVKCAKENTGKKLTGLGVEKHFNGVKAFLKWCFDRHATTQDYSRIPALRKPKNVTDSIERVPFSTDQLNLIFNSYIYKPVEKSKRKIQNHQFWLPLIALHSGMRIAEIVGLEKADIKQVDGIWVFDVNENWNSKTRIGSEHSKSKKNKSSCRLIPISGQLIEIGLLRYVEKLNDDDILFPELTLGKKKGLGDYASKWFNERFLKYIGLEKRSDDGKQSVSFHSFRHGFVTNIDKTELNGSVLNDSERHYITGHEQEGVRNKIYNHSGVNIARLKTFVDAIDFGVNLSDINYK
ncbi:site-specific integrase [Paraglaciecola arctica]|uniref:site-specific integrase n=1 Tax=Paraglaciecola arctica TaxID=1128911 RepID=UPI001C069297|nr:site-specific integrase [Paraglaciecola arctica]MBU3005959.1 site-specific integrase [Paraglaciecola arctica]